jgi:arginine decarboxylase
LRIHLSTGRGEGPTPLAAFDAALRDAGVANYNLICLSSVIPPNSEIVRTRFDPPGDEYGHQLYVVMARMDEQIPGRIAWAGLGWTQDCGDGRGLFVELHGSDRADVERRIHATLESMMPARSYAYGPIQSEIVGVECHNQPVCALVIAVYKSRGWDV